LIEVTVAVSLLAILLLALFGMQAGSQQSSVDTHEQIVAANAAHDFMESLLRLPDNQFISYYDSYISNGSPNFNQTFDVDGFPAGNGYGHFVVREPTQGEAPGYNDGNGPKQVGAGATSSAPGSWVPQAAPQYVPAAIAPPLNKNMSLFLVVVWVRIPHSAANSGRSGTTATETFVQLQAWRNFVS
jgi:type II secretory pathway pseudopilin PulG